MRTPRCAAHALTHLLAIALLCLAPAQARDCIGVVPAGGGYAFWRAVEAGAMQAGRDLGVDIYFRGPADEADIQAQAAIIERVMERGCRALVLAPNDPARASQVAALKAKGIPTVYIDRDTGGADVIGVVATDNFNAGRLAGEQMGKALGGHGNVALLRLKRGTVSTDDRERGFREGAVSSGLTITLDTYLGTGVGEARLNAQKAFEAHRGRLDGIFTPNESSTLATLEVLRSLNRAGKAIHIGFDFNERLTAALRAGDITGLVLQRPFDMGYQGVRIVYRTLHGEPVTGAHIDTGVVFATRANMGRPEVATLLR